MAVEKNHSSHLLVRLNVYDFIKNDSSLSNSVLSFLGLGIHHSGLEVDDTEFTFTNSGKAWRFCLFKEEAQASCGCRG